MRTECNIVDKNYTVDVEEYFDGAKNRALLVLTKGGVTKYHWFQYDVNQIVTWSQGKFSLL